MSGEQYALWDVEPTQDAPRPSPQRDDPTARELANTAARVLDWRRVFADRPATAIEWAQETRRDPAEAVPARERAWGRWRKALRRADVPGVAESQDDETGEALLALTLEAEAWANAHAAPPRPERRAGAQLDLIGGQRPPGPEELDASPAFPLPVVLGVLPYPWGVVTERVRHVRQVVNEIDHAERYGYASLPRDGALAQEVLTRCSRAPTKPGRLLRHLGIRCSRWREKASALIEWLGLEVDPEGYVRARRPGGP